MRLPATPDLHILHGPYVYRDVLPDKVKLEDFLLRHARVATSTDGENTPLYSAK